MRPINRKASKRVRPFVMYLLFLFIALDCNAELDLGSFMEIPFSSVTYRVKLPEPFGDTAIEIESTEDSMVRSIAIEFGEGRYEIPNEVFSDLRWLSAPDVTIAKSPARERDYVHEFVIWFEHGPTTGYDMREEDPDCISHCYLSLRPIWKVIVGPKGEIRTEDIPVALQVGQSPTQE